MVAVRELAPQGRVQAQQQSPRAGPKVVAPDRLDGFGPFSVVASHFSVGSDDVFLWLR